MAYTSEQYRKKVMEGVEGGPMAQGGAQAAEPDYHQMARDQEYKALLDKEIQLSNAKSNALKLTGNQMAAQGMAGTGYGSTVQSGIYGQYMNALGQAQSASQQNIANIDMQEAQAKQDQANDRFKSVTTMITGASDISQANDMLAEYGYGTVGEDGSFSWNEKPEGMSQDDWIQMKYYYNLKKDESPKGPDFSPAYDLNSYAALKNAAYSSDGKTLGADFNNETDYAAQLARDGHLKDGWVVRMKNDKGDVVYLEYTSQGFRIVQKGAYNAAGDNVVNLEWDKGAEKVVMK